jgi:UDP-N-acetylmuramoylalanine-D-glutamate ligase
MMTTIKTFKGLEHRIEWVTKKQNIDYYNDSKATNAFLIPPAMSTMFSYWFINALIAVIVAMALVALESL